MKINGKANYEMKFSWVPLFWILISAILFFGAIIAFYAEENNLIDISRPLGVIMLLAGIINMIVCIIKSHMMHSSRWLVADGITAILLSFFPLFNQMIMPMMIPFFFAMWELFSGVLKLMDSSELKNDGIICWPGFAFIGWIELVSGTAALMKPFDDFVGINKVLFMIFIVQSFGFLLKSIMYKYLLNK